MLSWAGSMSMPIPRRKIEINHSQDQTIRSFIRNSTMHNYTDAHKNTSFFGHSPKFVYDFYHTEIGKLERGEPAAVRRDGNVLYVQLPQQGNADKAQANTEAANKVAARQYLEWGWKLIRLPPRSKDPYKDKSHAEYHFTLENIDTLKEDENLGVYFQ